jgi:hypothetical protein
MPKQFSGKIKTKTKVVFNIETREDFWNCLEFCRFILVKELPDEIKNYIQKNANDPELIKRLNKDYYDFYNKEINYIYYQNNSKYLEDLDRLFSFQQGIVINLADRAKMKKLCIKNVIINGNKKKYYENFDIDICVELQEKCNIEFDVDTWDRKIHEYLADKSLEEEEKEEILKLIDIEYELYDDIYITTTSKRQKPEIISHYKYDDYLYDIEFKDFPKGSLCCNNNIVIMPKSGSNTNSNLLELYLYGKKLEEDGRIEMFKFGFIEDTCRCT